MALFIGSNLKTNNWGEDFVIQKCIEYFDDSCIIYRNREVFGTQFDICILLPNQGIAVIEVKAWRPTTILRVENGDSIVIKTANGEEVSTSPIKQARGYVFSLRNKVRQKTGKTPFIFPLVCFPQISLQDYNDKHLEPVCELETTLLKEDLASKAALYSKINLAMRNGQRTVTYCTPFNDRLMLQVRQLFESELELKSLDKDTKNEIVRSVPLEVETTYSLFSFFQSSTTLTPNEVAGLVRTYLSGTKLNIVVQEKSLLEQLAQAISTVLTAQGLQTCGENLKISLGEDQHSTSWKPGSTLYRTFNCLLCLASDDIPATIPSFQVVDGKVERAEYQQYLREI